MSVRALPGPSARSMHVDGCCKAVLKVPSRLGLLVFKGAITADKFSILMACDVMPVMS